LSSTSCTPGNRIPSSDARAKRASRALAVTVAVISAGLAASPPVRAQQPVGELPATGERAAPAEPPSAPKTAEPLPVPKAADCTTLLADAQRLACYDRAFGVIAPATAAQRDPPATATQRNASIAAAPTPASASTAAPPDATLPDPRVASYLDQAWELSPATRHSALTFQPYRPSYLMPLHWTDSVNRRPASPTRGSAGDVAQRLQATELAFQLSFKTRLLSDLLDGIDGNLGGDVWFAYTQNSFLQSYNRGLSAPFRETDYEPEFIFSLHPDATLAGWRWRVLNFGAVHESNGRGDPLSRSWNRLYVAAGIERGDLALIVRPWWRAPESRSEDDNPDIARYVGRGELQAIWSPGRQSIALTVRGTPSFSNARGSLALDWSFPIWSRLCGYARAFSGYGESLIDYNHRQNSLGLGVSLVE